MTCYVFKDASLGICFFSLFIVSFSSYNTTKLQTLELGLLVLISCFVIYDIGKLVFLSYSFLICISRILIVLTDREFQRLNEIVLQVTYFIRSMKVSYSWGKGNVGSKSQY